MLYTVLINLLLVKLYVFISCLFCPDLLSNVRDQPPANFIKPSIIRFRYCHLVVSTLLRRTCDTVGCFNLCLFHIKIGIVLRLKINCGTSPMSPQHYVCLWSPPPLSPLCLHCRHHPSVSRPATRRGGRPFDRNRSTNTTPYVREQREPIDWFPIHGTRLRYL
jgi:hypothetical protein